MLKNLMRLLKDDEGATAVEYALIVAGIAVAIVVAVYAIGTNASAKFQKVADTLSK